MSVDGCIAGPNGEMDWMVVPLDDGLKYVSKITEPVDTILLGRKMTDLFISFWLEMMNKPDESLSEFQDNNADNNCLAPEVKQEEVIFTNDIFIPPSNIVIDYPPNENETPYYSSRVEPSSRTLVFDTKDLFPKRAQT